MRPISIEMEGFISFRERASIDFSNLDLFAITGPTGAGKTSIIDAMTYALYGCTPRVGVGQVSDLISQGMNRGSVLLRFSSGKKEYRIARVAKWTGKQTNTDLRLEQRTGDEWISLADGVQKAKPLIEEVVGLDFNGFTKSVVLPQGRFDEFLKGKADDRRKILSDLLDLDIYTRMMRRANEMHSQHKAKATAIDEVLKKEYAEATSEHLSNVRNLLEETTPQLEPIELQLKVTAKFLPVALGLRQARAELLKCETEFKAIGPKRKSAEDDLQKVRKRIGDLEDKLGRISAALKLNTYDSKQHIHLSGLMNKAQRLEVVLVHFEQIERTQTEKVSQLTKLDGLAKKLKATSVEADDAYLAAQKDLEKDRKALGKLKDEYKSPEAIQSAIENQKELAKLQKAHAKLESELRTKEDDQTKLEKELVLSEAEALSAQQRHDLARSDLEALIRRHSAEALKPGLRAGEPCPVCEQPVECLPKVRQHKPLEDAQREQQESARGTSVIEKRVAHLQAQVQGVERELESLRTRIADSADSLREAAYRLQAFAGVDLVQLKKDFESAQAKVDDASRRLDNLKAAAAKALTAVTDQQHQSEIIQTEIDGYTRDLTKSQKEADKLRDELGEFVNAKKLLADVMNQEKARTERESLIADRDVLTEQVSKAKDEVGKAMAQLEGLEATRKKVEEMGAALQLRIDEQTVALKAEFPDLAKASGERDEAFQLDQRSRDLQSRRDVARKKIDDLQGQIKTLERKIVRAAAMREELENHRTKASVAKTLGNSLQGDNFIAFIQGEAYARLAADGSVQLKTLSADRYSFSVEKDEFQVVDHWNASERRPVTTLSGGESFLASLALALALAEGLSGLSSGHTRFALESLFLDEGFGTLDPETLELVVAGIEGLSTNDRLIGIVSHISELVERMPSRIQVVKSVSGSSIEMN